MNERTLKCVSSDKSCTINQYKLQTIALVNLLAILRKDAV